MSKEYKKCPSCGGSGANPTSSTLKDCSTCKGKGTVKRGLHERINEKDRQFLGGAGGTVAGWAIGGPFGGIVGGIIGAVLSTEDDDGVSGQ